MVKESINVLQAMTEHCDRIPKRAVSVYSPFLCEKIGDIKVTEMIKSLFLKLTDFVTAKYIAVQIAKFGVLTKVPKTIENSCLVMITLLQEWGAAMMPVKEVLDFGVASVGNANVQVRQAANKLFCELYKHLGEAIRNFFSDIKESTLKVIESEIANVTPYQKGEF